jgi:hypothetical protein
LKNPDFLSFLFLNFLARKIPILNLMISLCGSYNNLSEIFNLDSNQRTYELLTIFINGEVISRKYSIVRHFVRDEDSKIIDIPGIIVMIG